MIVHERLRNVFPSEEEMKTAQELCCGRYCNQCETPTAYAWRKREVDMAILLERAIENELSQSERNVLTDYWYNSLTQTQIADKRKVSPAAVNNTLERAKEKIERVLSYVVMYQQNVCESSVVPVIIGKASAVAALRNCSAETISERLVYLRNINLLSVESVSAATDIPKSRLLRIEKSSMPDCEELVILSEFYSVTTDYILKGETGE